MWHGDAELQGVLLHRVRDESSPVSSAVADADSAHIAHTRCNGDLADVEHARDRWWCVRPECGAQAGVVERVCNPIMTKPAPFFAPKKETPAPAEAAPAPAAEGDATPMDADAAPATADAAADAPAEAAPAESAAAPADEAMAQ